MTRSTSLHGLFVLAFVVGCGGEPEPSQPVQSVAPPQAPPTPPPAPPPVPKKEEPEYIVIDDTPPEPPLEVTPPKEWRLLNAVAVWRRTRADGGPGVHFQFLIATNDRVRFVCEVRGPGGTARSTTERRDGGVWECEYLARDADPRLAYAFRVLASDPGRVVLPGEDVEWEPLSEWVPIRVVAGG